LPRQRRARLHCHAKRLLKLALEPLPAGVVAAKLVVGNGDQRLQVAIISQPHTAPRQRHLQAARRRAHRNDDLVPARAHDDAGFPVARLDGCVQQLARGVCVPRLDVQDERLALEVDV
jgi:hypothetical protein